MAWIESHQELRDHPKVKKAARLLGVPRPLVVGYLQYLWWWAMDYAQDGDLSGYTPEDIADAISWEGDPVALVDALVECGPIGKQGFLERTSDGRLLLHDWYEYAGKLIDRRETERERQRKRRAVSPQRPQDVPLTKEGVLVQRTPDVGPTTAGTVPNRTQPTEPTKPNQPEEPAVPAEPALPMPTTAPDADAPASQEKPKRTKAEKAEKSDKPRGVNLAPLFDAFDAAGVERPIVETVKEKAAAQFLVKYFSGELSAIPECMTDIAVGRYGSDYERRKLCLALLAGDNFFQNWLRWRDDGKPPQQARGNGNGTIGANPGAANGRDRQQPGADGSRTAGSGPGLPERWDLEPAHL